MRKTQKAWAGIGLLAVVGAIVWLVAGGLSSNVVYFLTPSELLARGTDVVNRPVRLGGQVKPGTLEWNADSLDLRFVVRDSAGEVPVRSHGAPPSMFREGIGVVVEGRYRKDGLFESTNLMVKHSNEYRPPHDAEMPQKMYESLVQPAGSK